MTKPNEKEKNQPHVKKIPTLDEIKIEKPLMTDESAARYRASLIVSGQLIQSTNPEEAERLENGFMSLSAVNKLKAKLVSTGHLRPGAGLSRLKAKLKNTRSRFEKTR